MSQTKTKVTKGEFGINLCQSCFDVNIPEENATTYTRDYLSFLRGKGCVVIYLPYLWRVHQTDTRGCMGTDTVIIPSSEITIVEVLPGGTTGSSSFQGLMSHLSLITRTRKHCGLTRGSLEVFIMSVKWRLWHLKGPTSSPKPWHFLAFHNDTGVKGGLLSPYFEVFIKQMPGQCRVAIGLLFSGFFLLSNLGCRGSTKWLRGIRAHFRGLNLVWV